MTPEMYVEKAIKDAGMTLKAVSVRSGVPYSKLQPSVRGRRELRADEYLSVCAILGLDPRGHLNAAE